MNRWKVSKAKVARARSISELNAEISTALSENAAGIEKIFEEIDELNHGWLTIESLYQARVKIRYIKKYKNRLYDRDFSAKV